MELEELGTSFESSEGTTSNVESVSESIKEYKDRDGKAQAGIKRVQKDEQKARKYDFLLAGFLVGIIIDKKYDFILMELFESMSAGYPSNFVLGVLSLINIEISNEIRKFSLSPLINFNYKGDSNIEDEISTEVKDRINEWIEDIIHSVTLDYSNVQIYETIVALEIDKSTINKYMSLVLEFFLKEINIKMEKKELLGIVNFIISEISKKTKAIMSLSHDINDII